MSYLVRKITPILGAVVILGTGTRIAFFMLMARLSRDTTFVPRTAGMVVPADALFTATVVIAQPITGLLLTRGAGFPLWEG
ncbi:DUF2269 family protein [Methylobacterium sp. P1-11]|uniref:DUF2269 family protein n=1 Tax=Methylobacterium sp. P1-11 TaxID=2024616 RepID=UPI0011EFC817|nr:DUF2269 family protein [Methylobacterium sp. P1-11]KAA0124592.1 DUF2269 family protein [Methylobacterium sp. P1-11]